MKKICYLLILALLMGATFCLFSCNESASITSGDIKNYQTFNNGDISFAYPEGWTKTEGSVTVLINETGEGNNITIAYETANDTYSKLQSSDFDKEFGAAFASVGLKTSNGEIAQLENSSTKITRVSFDIILNDSTMKQTMYIVSASLYSYKITVTEVTPDKKLVENVFKTIKVETPPTDVPNDEISSSEAPEGYRVYSNGTISFAYPENWTKTDGSMVLLKDEATGNNISVSYEPKTDAYEGFDTSDFDTVFKPALDSMGLSVTNANISQKKINDLRVAIVSYSAEANGSSMTQTLYIVTAGEFTYTVAITEKSPDSELVSTVLNTLKTVK